MKTYKFLILCIGALLSCNRNDSKTVLNELNAWVDSVRIQYVPDKRGKTVYLKHGVVLRRDASQQAKTGIPVDISEGYDKLRPGDLLFFGKNRVRHVAIYLGNIRAKHRFRLRNNTILFYALYQRPSHRPLFQSCR